MSTTRALLLSRGAALALIAGFLLFVHPDRAMAQRLHVATGSAAPPGSQTGFVVLLYQDGSSCRSAQVFIAYDSVNTPVMAKANGTPDCSVPASVSAAKSVAFAFWPNGCSGTQCRQVRAFIYEATSSPSQIPVDAGILLTCKVSIATTAPNGSYPLVVTDARTGDVNGNEFVTGRLDGALMVNSSATPPSGC